MNGLVVMAAISLVFLCYRGVGFFAVRKSGSDVKKVVTLMDDVSDSINVEDGISVESSAQIELQIKDALTVVERNQKDRSAVVRIMSLDLYLTEGEFLTSSVNYLESAEDLAVRCSQGEDTWDNLEMLRERHEEYVNSREQYFSVESSARRRFLLDL